METLLSKQTEREGTWGESTGFLNRERRNGGQIYRVSQQREMERGANLQGFSTKRKGTGANLQGFSIEREGTGANLQGFSIEREGKGANLQGFSTERRNVGQLYRVSQ